MLPALAAQVDVLAGERRPRAVRRPSLFNIVAISRSISYLRRSGRGCAAQPRRLGVLVVARTLRRTGARLLRRSATRSASRPGRARALVQGHLSTTRRTSLALAPSRGGPPNPRQVSGQARTSAHSASLGVPACSARQADRPARLLEPAQLLLPCPLQGARHQAVLRLDRIILPPRPLGLVARPLALEAPLPVQGRAPPPPSRPRPPPPSAIRSGASAASIKRSTQRPAADLLARPRWPNPDLLRPAAERTAS